MALKELQEKRSKLLADRKAISDKAAAENRAFTAEESTAIAQLKAQYDGILATCAELSEQEAQAKLLDEATRAAVGRKPSEDDLQAEISEKDVKSYSLLRAIRRYVEQKPLDGLEKDMSDHLAKKYNSTPKGFYVPSRVLVQPRATATDTSTGSGGVSTVTSSDYIDALRNYSVLGQLPLTVLSQLQGKFAFPRTAGVTSYWPGEGTAITDGAITLDAVTLSNKPVGARNDFTRSFIKQTSLSVEMFARDQITRSIGAAICTAVMNGTGGNNTLLGVLNRTDNCLVTAISGAQASSGAVPANLTGAAMTWALAVAMETIVGAQNVMIDTGAYVTSSAGRGTMKTVAKASNAPLFIWEDGLVNGYPALATNCIPSSNGTNSASNAAVFGDWRQGILGLWGALDITVDPYALATSGGVRVIGIQDVDFQEQHAGAFARLFGIAS